MAPPQTEQVLKCSNPICKGHSAKDLLLCSGCKQARYCSKDCQKQDRKDHKTFCQHISTNGASSKFLEPAAYHQKVAAYDPQADILARNIGLTLPSRETELRGINFPMRRLVVAGEDTPENLSLFFGQSNSIQGLHKDVRLEILLQPPPGSTMYALAVTRKLDEGCPPWKVPRGPSAAELLEVLEITDLQKEICSWMEARGIKDISMDDVSDILLGKFGDQWVTKLPIYILALESLDLGIEV
ncbi:hypothetical protein F5Y04DRAFT_289074 [Hypomontagnella monticulosa]|nr:hypothetical protein F5Y04DRAFT_289074 [Hypomontagnella monticulosa]